MSAETGTPASVIVLDVDRLKLANDTRGHEFGDELLRMAARIVRDTVRYEDIVARVGGDEIAILLPHADEARCAEAVLRLRAAFEAAAPLAGFRLSAAVGWATTSGGSTLAEAQQLADARMYEEKSASKQQASQRRLPVASASSG